MRRLTSALGVVAAVPVLLAVPVTSRPASAPHPVPVSTSAVSLVPAAGGSGLAANLSPRRTSRFTMVGAAWSAGRLDPSTRVEVRTHAHGGWSGWTVLSLPDGGPDAGSADARAAAAHHASATDPVWVGDADGVQARVLDSRGMVTMPTGLHLELVDGGHASADASPGAPSVLGGVADAAPTQPTIYTRAQWGADESLRRWNGSGCATPSYSSTIKLGFVHHTDGANGYSASDVPSILRGIYAYHVKSNGWCDVGYNFLVDRFGRIWEGRYGGIGRAVIGAHTGGFNTNSFAASLIGSYTSVAPNSAMLTSVEKLFAWKLGSYYRDPSTTTTTTAGSFSGSRYPAGSTVTFRVISGHRDADYTTCPGTAAYSKLASIRSAVRSLLGAGLVAPSVSATSLQMASGKSFVVKSGFLTSSASTWNLTVTDSAGHVVTTSTGTGSTSAPLSTGWNLTDATGVPVLPGTYTLTLTSTNASSTGVPFTRKVTVTPPVTITAPAQSALGAHLTLKGTAPPSATVQVSTRNLTSGLPAVQRTVVAGSTGAWSLPLTADGDYSSTATLLGYTTPAVVSRVAPTVTTPAASGGNVLVARGGKLGIAGTAVPGTTVTVVRTPAGGPAVTSAPLAVAADGSWAGPTLAPTVATTVAVRDGRGLAAGTFTVFPVGTATATAPTTGWSARSLAVTGNGGSAPVRVQIATWPAGAAGYSVVKTLNAPASGAFSTAVTLPTVTASSTMKWRVTTTDATGSKTFGTVLGATTVKPAFAPTATAARTAYYAKSPPVTGRAVPGDTVTVWTEPAGGGTWSRAGTARADAASGAWSFALPVRSDLSWKVTSPSGATAPASIVVLPWITAPGSAARGALITVSGTALPGQQVVLYRHPDGGTTWAVVARPTASGTGAWSTRIHVYVSPSLQARSHGQTSRTIVVRTA